MSANQIFSHSGDVGDLVAGLSAVEAAGGGELLLVPGRCAGGRMTPQRVESLRSFLEQQPYVKGVWWSKHPIGFNLDEWRRQHLRRGGPVNIADAHHDAMRVPHRDRNLPWLFVDSPCRSSDVVFARGPRWRNTEFGSEWWRRLYADYGQRAVFVGHPEEHREFVRDFGPIVYRPTADYLELARVIAGCNLFCGSQSSPFWVAEGFKRLICLEVSTTHKNCYFARQGLIYGDHIDADRPLQSEVDVAAEQNERIVDGECEKAGVMHPRNPPLPPTLADLMADSVGVRLILGVERESRRAIVTMDHLGSCGWKNLEVMWGVDGSDSGQVRSSPFRSKISGALTYPRAAFTASCLAAVHRQPVPNYLLWFEDDAAMHKRFVALGSSLWDQTVQKDVDIVYFGSEMAGPPTGDSVAFDVPAFCTHAMLYTRRGLMKIRRLAAEPGFQSEVWDAQLATWVRRGCLRSAVWQFKGDLPVGVRSDRADGLVYQRADFPSLITGR